jgi:hypothetical protein
MSRVLESNFGFFSRCHAQLNWCEFVSFWTVAQHVDSRQSLQTDGYSPASHVGSRVFIPVGASIDLCESVNANRASGDQP